MQNIEDFFKTQVGLFDSAVAYERSVGVDQEYLDKDETAGENLNQIRLITKVSEGEKFNFRRIPELNDLVRKVKEVHDRLLEEKRQEIDTVVNECLNAIHEATYGKDDLPCTTIVDKAETYFSQKRQQISGTNGLTLLDGLVPQMWQYKDNALSTIESCQKPQEVTSQKTDSTKSVEEKVIPPKIKNIKNVSRMAVFPGKILETKEDIDIYVEKIRSDMKKLLEGYDGIKLN